MTNRKKLALALAAVLTVSLFSAYADTPEAPGAVLDPADLTSSLLGGEPADAAPSNDLLIAPNPNAGGLVIAPNPSASDPEGVLSFENLDARVRNGSTDALYLGELIAQINATDYEALKEEMRDGLNDLVDLKMSLQSSPGINTGMPPLDSALNQMVSASTASTLQAVTAQYESLRDQYDALKNGELQEDMDDQIWQLRTAQDTIVLMAESAYIQLLEARAGSETLDRSLAALDRQVQEMELRYQMGQISALNLQELKGGRTSLDSTRRTVANSLDIGMMSLKNLVGEDLSADLTLTELPEVTDKQLAAIDVEADLVKAKEASFSLYSAKLQLDEAEEVYEDACDEYEEEDYKLTQAKHAWQAAQYTYEGALRSFELSFRTLCAQITDNKQVLDAAKTALAVEQASYAAAQLKYEQGTISHNALLTARDELSAAQDAVDTAARTLFSSYNNYCWAVKSGILN